MKRLLLTIISLALASASMAGSISRLHKSPDGGPISPTSVTVTSSSDGCLEVDSPTLSVDCSADRVGIGTASPSEILHVLGNPILFQRTDGGDMLFQMRPGDTSSSNFSGFEGLTSAGAGHGGVQVRNDSNRIVLYKGGAPDSGVEQSIVMTATEGIWNENGLATSDFRMLGDTDNNAFFLDASADCVAIGNNGCTSGLDMFKGLGLWSQTKASWSTTAPAEAGQIVFCSDCSPAKILLSTGTSAGNWADAVGGDFQ